ncbi:hypothetical protein NDN08_004847 [Rhodosorus marinus]|uniref:Uncharacterized protein n=1 Tax=Rhodosorus marinus TaxID=101924 RepID=A0AAV8UQ85_9RHOD|nr:hypothetical protein NDN08_004847 [Rhodosorus marinus]
MLKLSSEMSCLRKVEIDVLSANVPDLDLVQTVETRLVGDLLGLLRKYLQLDPFAKGEDKETSVRIIPAISDSLPRSQAVEALVDRVEVLRQNWITTEGNILFDMVAYISEDTRLCNLNVLLYLGIVTDD